MTADMGAQSLERFKQDLPDQYINVGIAEQNLVSVAAGLALSGKHAFVYAIAPFITQRCYEQVRVDLVWNEPSCHAHRIGAGHHLRQRRPDPSRRRGYRYHEDAAEHDHSEPV